MPGREFWDPVVKVGEPLATIVAELPDLSAQLLMTDALAG